MVSSTSNLNKIAPLCLFVNGAIFVFYGLSVPIFIPRGIHLLITLAALLFIVALPAIYHNLSRVHNAAAKAVVIVFGVGMILILVSDILFLSSQVPRFTHDLIYASGDALFVVSLLAIGALAWQGVFPKWFSVLSLVTGILGVLTYLPSAFPLFVPSLLLVGLWSFAMGFTLRRSK